MAELEQKQQDMRNRQTRKKRRAASRYPVAVTGLEVAQKLADGMAFKEIAYEFGGSLKTMHLRARAEMRKIGAKSTYQMIAMLSANGALTRPEVKK